MMIILINIVIFIFFYITCKKTYDKINIKKKIKRYYELKTIKALIDRKKK